MTRSDIQSLGVTLGDRLFTDRTLTIAKGDRIGLVAANGRGKSTLPGCIAGHSDPTQGEITRARGLRIGHVGEHLIPDDADLTLHDVVLRALPPEQADGEAWRVGVALDDLQVPPALHQQRLSTRSGGCQRTALRAAEWVAEPDVLLLDEPTNHLDIDGQEALEEELVSKGAACLPVSHDRQVLRAVGIWFWQIIGTRLVEVDDAEAFLAGQMA